MAEDEKKKKIKPRKQNKWSDQAWLVSNSEYWFKPGIFTLYTEFKYSSVLQGSAVDHFMNLKGRDLSILQPYFKLEKWVYKESIKGNKLIKSGGGFRNYPITTLQRDIDDVAKKRGKIPFVTIKSVEVRRGEKRIGEKNIEFTLVFHASSYEAFTKKRKGVALIDFIRRSQTSKIENAKDPNVTNPRDHAARLTIGIAAPNGQSFNSLTEKNFLSNGGERVKRFATSPSRQIRLMGTLLDHDVTLNSDGSLDVTITFLGMMDTFFENPELNILFNTKKATPIQKKIDELQKKITKTTKKGQRTTLQKELESMKKTYAEEAYKDIIRDFKKKGYVLQASVSPKIINAVTNRLTPKEQYEQDEEAKKKSAKGTTQGGKYAYRHIQTKIMGKRFASKFYKELWVAPPKPDSKPVKYKAGAVSALRENPVEYKGARYTPRVILYVPLGVIIAYFMDNALRKAVTPSDNKYLNFTPNIAIGNIRFSQTSGASVGIPSLMETGGKFFKTKETIHEANMGTIPVALSTFQKWFVKYVSGQNKTTISMRQFLMNLLQNLIAESFDSFGPACFAPRLWNANMNYYSYNKGTSLHLSALNGGTVQDKYVTFKLAGSQAVVKNVSFSKANVSKHFGAAQQGKAAFSDTGIVRFPTEATIEMVGNPFFKNGQLIIIDPRGFIPVTKDAGQLGIGGAYRIISTQMNWEVSSWTTTIKAVFESAYKKNRTKAVKGSTTGTAYIDFPDIERGTYGKKAAPGSVVAEQPPIVNPTNSPRQKKCGPNDNSNRCQIARRKAALAGVR